MKSLAKVAVVLVVFVSIVAAVFWYVHRKAQTGRLALLNAEYSYLTALQGILQNRPIPEAGSSLSAFVSASSLNSILSGFDGLSFVLPKPKDTTLKLGSVRADFRDGFPGVIANLHISHRNPDAQLDAELYSALEPRIDATNPSNLLLYIHPLYLDAGVAASQSSSSIAESISPLLGDLAAQYSDVLPHLTVPLARDFSFSFPASRLPLSVPTQNGKLNGEIDVPALSGTSAVSVSGILFLSDGIHVFLSANTPAPAVFPYQIDGATQSYSNPQSLETAIQEQEGRITELRNRLQPLVNPIKVKDSDFRIWVSKNLITLLSDMFNSLSVAERTIHYHTLSEDGQIYRAGGGGVGCGGYANVVGGNSANGDLQLGTLTTAWTNQGMAASTQFQFSFNAQVTGHVNGPAGPHPTMALNCVELFHRKICTNVPSVTVSCDTPVGGGVGLSNYGVHGNRTDTLTTSIALRSDSSHWLIYDIAFTSPDQIPITVEVGLGQLGTVGIPISFGVPHQVLLSGNAPNVFSAAGTLELPASHSSKSYNFAVTPTGGTVQDNGYVAIGKLNVQWK